jgi:hypothetical protein
MGNESMVSFTSRKTVNLFQDVAKKIQSVIVKKPLRQLADWGAKTLYNQKFQITSTLKT